jgi:hypothetical protein
MYSQHRFRPEFERFSAQFGVRAVRERRAPIARARLNLLYSMKTSEMRSL